MSPFAWPPPAASVKRVVVPAFRSRTNPSASPLVSPATRFEARDSEGDERAVVRDERADAEAVADRAARRDADRHRLARQPVAQEDVEGAVAVVRDHVGCRGGEGEPASVAADPGEADRAVAGLAVVADRLQRRRAGLPVADVELHALDCHAGDQVAGARREGDVAAVGRDRLRRAGAVRLEPAGPERDAGGGPGREVADEDVAGAVRVAADEVAGVGLEHDAAAVPRDRAAAGWSRSRACRPVARSPASSSRACGRGRRCRRAAPARPGCSPSRRSRPAGRRRRCCPAARWPACRPRSR